MRADTVSLIDKLAREHRLKKKEYLALLENASVEEHVHAATLADKERRRIYGTEVFIRGLIEVGNICRNNCYYCGIRASNGKCVRYTLTDKQILACCREGHEIGFRSFVLQGGEGAFPVERVIRIVSEIRGEFPDCAITLSLGEYERDEYEKMFNAGANRYLLRHETADEKHYGLLHPGEMSYKHRVQCLESLREVGFTVGCGFMVGSPFQTLENISSDLKVFAGNVRNWTVYSTKRYTVRRLSCRLGRFDMLPAVVDQADKAEHSASGNNGSWLNRTGRKAERNPCRRKCRHAEPVTGRS